MESGTSVTVYNDEGRCSVYSDVKCLWKHEIGILVKTQGHCVE